MLFRRYPNVAVESNVKRFLCYSGSAQQSFEQRALTNAIFYPATAKVIFLHLLNYQFLCLFALLGNDAGCIDIEQRKKNCGLFPLLIINFNCKGQLVEIAYCPAQW